VWLIPAEEMNKLLASEMGFLKISSGMSRAGKNKELGNTKNYERKG
jgi:hypothetical protein